MAPTLTVDTAGAVLDAARSSRRRLLAEEAAQLRLAVEWAAMHSVDSLTDAARFGDAPVAVAGPGAPLVSEFCIAEFAAALGMPTEVGKAYVGQALELAHRLPRLWARVQAGDLPGWRARRLAAATVTLSPEAAGFVDAQIAHIAHRVGPAVTDRLIDTAIARFMPDAAKAERDRAADRTYLDVDHRQVSFAGTSRVYGELDLADAIDLDAALTARAAHLKNLGATGTLDQRRARALAEIARRDLALDLEAEVSGDPAAGPPVTRETVIRVTIARDGATATVANTGSLITLDQLRDWCSNPFTRVVIKPVIDLDDHHETDAL